ncbi:hypothetical protein MVEG_11937 [Podila verticillata NRRL 6337]|uniref:Rho-GAP domain-containing protein n=1 Tax=Podila verticillata NRRL 6337 TaxID=1069443 RepID=A0A086TKR7_9FUNG|nr:hypothetical protein MVEG_11937 [Podila verticillata NRRL 6337]
MFRLVNKRLALNKELESLKQDFNQCSLPIEFVYRIVVLCVDEIMERGLNHPFILRNPYSPSVVAAMLTLMADPERRDFFSLKCMRIDTVAGVMLAVLKNLREAIVPMEIQDELTSATGGFTNSGSSSPTTPSTRLARSPSSYSLNKINTINSLLNHSHFPAVNRALLMELLNLSLAILNRSTFNRVKPDMLASILGPHIFASQHATILQHTPQQAYSFGWGVALVNDIKRCSKMFYVLLGGYRREVLGPDEWEYDHPFASTPSGYFTGAPLSAISSRGQVNQWLGSTANVHGTGRVSDDDPYFSHHHRARMHLNVPQVLVTADYESGGPRGPLSRYGMVRNVSTTLSESIRAQAAQEARQWNLDQSGSGSKGPAALEHLRGHSTNWSSRQQNPSHRYYGGYQGIPQQQQQQQQQQHQQHQQHQQQQNQYRHSSGVEHRQQELFQNRFRKEPEESINELEHVFRRHNLRQQQQPETERHSDDSGISSSHDDDDDEPSDAFSRQKNQKRQAIEQMIRECRGSGLNFAVRDSESAEEPNEYEHGSYGRRRSD